ncbi:MAG: hypothetical protein KDK53_20900 [Maritimibacter sp.]|nr:hypothetical protein [Maritimibacter sp.]
MTLLLFLLGAIGGLVAGGFIGFFGVIAIGMATGDTGFEGALAMGAATGGMPVGAVIGAIVGVALVWRAQTSDRPLLTPRGWAIALAVTALVVVGWAARVTSLRARELPRPYPEFLVELRVPDAFAQDAELGKLWPRHYRDGTGAYTTPDSEIARRTEGGYTFVTLRYYRIYRVTPHRLAVQIDPETWAVWDLPFAATPVPTEGYSDWWPPDHYRADPAGEDLVTATPEDLAIRTHVYWPGR